MAVVDVWQGRGLGGMLLERLVHRAGEEGVLPFEAGAPREALRLAAAWKPKPPASPP